MKGGKTKKATLKVWLNSCRGWTRTTTERLATRQKTTLVVNPLPCVYFWLPTPETGGHVCQFQHPTFLNMAVREGLEPPRSSYVLRLSCYLRQRDRLGRLPISPSYNIRISASASPQS